MSRSETQPPTAAEQRRAVVEHARRQRRKRLTLTVVSIAVTMVVVTVVTISSLPKPLPPLAADQFPSGSDAHSLALVEGTGPVMVDVYADPLCPACREADLAVTDTLERNVTSGRVTVKYHVLGNLDRYSNPTGYSSRASAAAGCAADQRLARPYLHELFRHQPPEGSAGLSEADLIGIGVRVGADEGSFRMCVESGRYSLWVRHASEQAGRDGVFATPTYLVGGRAVSVSKDRVAAALEEAIG